MGLYSTLNIGITALQSQSNAIGIISDNIANANTTGYKESVANFADIISDDSTLNFSVNGKGNGSVVGYDPSGVLGGLTQYNRLQGTITNTNSLTDVAISGNGFLPVTSSPTASSANMLYTRVGSFTENGNGDLVNSNGYFLQGWPLDANGALAGGLSTTDVSSGAALGALKPVNISQTSVGATPTSTVALKINLNSGQGAYAGPPTYNATDNTANMASGSIPPQFTAPVTVIDNTGVSHTITAGFLKTTGNTWAVELYATPATDVTASDGQLAHGTVTFNGDGTLASVSPSLTQPVPITWTNAAAPNAVSFGWGTAGVLPGTPNATNVGKMDGLSQTAGGYSIVNIAQNGVQPGTLSGVSITADGYVVGSYTNNTTRNLYKIPLADFREPNALESHSNNVFSQTEQSGIPVFHSVGQGGSGKLAPSSLEASNVDLATQLTSMIIAQNAYQSNSKLISTSDTMLTTLVQMGTT